MKETMYSQPDSVAIPTLEANLGKLKLDVPHEHYAVGFFQKHCWEIPLGEAVSGLCGTVKLNSKELRE